MKRTLHSTCRRMLDEFVAGPMFRKADVLPAGRLLTLIQNDAGAIDGWSNLTIGWASEAIDLDDEGMVELRRVVIDGKITGGRFELRLKERYRR